MTDTISLTGVVATTPRILKTSSGLSILSFRLASSQRRLDRTRGVWIDGETNWYTITAFRQLADNAAASLSKGDRVIAAGRLRVRAWESADRSGTTVEVDAESLGPDLLWGTTTYTRSTPRAPDPGAAAPGESDLPSSGPGSDHRDSAMVVDEERRQVDAAVDEGADRDVERAAEREVERELVSVGAPDSRVEPVWHPSASDERPF